jgi:hypothetical protein
MCYITDIVWTLNGQRSYEKYLFLLVSTDMLNVIPNLVGFGKQEIVSNRRERGNPFLTQNIYLVPRTYETPGSKITRQSDRAQN